MESSHNEESSDINDVCCEDFISFTKDDSEFSALLDIWKHQKRSDCNIQNPQKLSKCLPCNKVSTYKQYFRHFKSVHGQTKRKQIRLRQGNTIFQCLICKKQYPENTPSSEFKLHLLSHTQQQLIEAGYDINKIWKNSKAVYDILANNELSSIFNEESFQHSEELSKVISNENKVILNQVDFEQKLNTIIKSSQKQDEKQKQILYLQFPYVNIILQEDISSIIQEANQSGILINSEKSFDNISHQYESLFNEIYERKDL